MLAGRRIVLGVTGGVAAYKSAYIARRLIERGAQVRVVMTPAATKFIGSATFAALTGTDPVVDLLFRRGPLSAYEPCSVGRRCGGRTCDRIHPFEADYW